MRNSSEIHVGHAVLVGADAYADPRISNLPASRADVELLANVLGDPNCGGYRRENVKTITGAHANRSGIVDSLGWLAKCAAEEPDTTSLFYFSGHGLKQTGGDSSHYLLPTDADLECIDESAVSASELTSLLDQIISSRVLVLLDACHAAGTTKEPRVAPLGFKWSSMPPRVVRGGPGRGVGRVILSSCGADERSFLAAPHFDASIFTLELIDALSGRAHTYKQDSLGVVDLFQYLDATVPVRARAQLDATTCQPAQQHPIMDGTKMDNFPVVRLLSKPAQRGVLTSAADKTNLRGQSLVANDAGLDDVVSLYEEQRIALERDLALSAQDGQARVILHERLRIINDEIRRIERDQESPNLM